MGHGNRRVVTLKRVLEPHRPPRSREKTQETEPVVVNAPKHIVHWRADLDGHRGSIWNR